MLLQRRNKPSPWFGSFGRRAAPTCRILALPYAGGTCTVFRSWPKLLANDVELLPVQLPGRGARHEEPAFDGIAALAAALADAVEPELDLPWALFGHCMGNVVGFELVRVCRDRGWPEPFVLVAAARRAPRLPLTGEPLSGLADDDFLRELGAMSGMPENLLLRPDLARAVLPSVRADFRICERYRYEPAEPLTCRIHAVGGIEDDVTDEQLDAWQHETTGSFARSLVPGDHFFLEGAAVEITSLLQSEVRDMRHAHR